MVFLLPYNAAHAATPTVSLSTISSGALTAATSGTVGSTLVVTGAGFAPNAAIAITTTVGTSTTAWLSNAGGCAVTNGGTSTTTPAVDSLVSQTVGTTDHCLVTSATGNFAVEVKVPALPGGAQTVSVTDGVSTGTASFTISPKVSIAYTSSNFGFPQQALTGTISLSGFGASEIVTISTPMWTTTSFTPTTLATGSQTQAFSVNVADTTGGSKTVTATGGTSGLSATTTYTVNPWAAFYNSQTGPTIFSFPGSAPTSILVEAHGLPSGTIASNSITIGGVATSHTAVVVGTSGAFGGALNELVVAPSAQVPFGPATVVIDGISFNYAAGNIASGAGTWGGAVISSIIGSAGSTTVINLDASNYQPGGYAASTTSPAPQTSQIGLFGYGIVPGDTVTVTSPTGATLTGISTHLTASTSGAIFAVYSLGDTPWSATATPTVAASYTIGISGTGTANTLAPSFGITAWASAPTVTTADFATSTSVTVHGFSATEIVSVKVGGSTLASPSGTCTTGATAGSCTETGTVPDVAGGSQSVTATGGSSGATATDGTSITVDAIASSNGGQTILPNGGSAGTSVQIRTASTYGIHGLLANTAYDVVWNAIGGSSVVGSFTSTASGGIPVPGVTFTVPSDSSGIHILDIQTASGASALLGGTVLGTTSQSITGYTTTYGDMLFSNTAALTASPSVANIGVPEMISGGGLAAGGSYVISLSSTGLCAAQTTQPAIKQFTATSSGTVPSGTAVSMTDTPTTTETGTVENFAVQTAASFGINTNVAACAQFVLAASASDNSSAEPAGHSVTLTAHGLNGLGATYNIVFNYAPNALGNGYTGTTVGVLAPSTTGAATATWTIPSGTAAATYAVQLVVSHQGGTGTCPNTTCGLAAGSAVLNIPLSISVGGAPSSCNTTACVAVSGSTFGQQGFYNGISSSFTNNSNQPVTAFAYAVVHNALGQTIDISTATLNNVAAGGSSTAFNVLFGLAPGTYSVTIFVTSSAGTAISSASTVSVTIP